MQKYKLLCSAHYSTVLLDCKLLFFRLSQLFLKSYKKLFKSQKLLIKKYYNNTVGGNLNEKIPQSSNPFFFFFFFVVVLSA